MTSLALIWSICLLSFGYTLGALSDARGVKTIGAVFCLALWAAMGQALGFF